MAKKLLFIGSFPPPYHGSVIDNLNITKNWSHSEIDLSVLDISNHKKTFFEYGGKITKGNVLNTLKGVIRLLTIIPSWKYDYVLSHLSNNFLGVLKDSLLIFIMRIFTKCKIICRFPAGDFLPGYNNAGVYRFFIKSVLRKIDLLITEGENIFPQFYEIDRTINVKSAHIGVPDHGIENYKIPSQHFEVLYLCYHCKKKGFWDVLYSIPNIVKENPAIIFNFVGFLVFDEIKKKKINRFICDNSLNNNIKFHGIKIGNEKTSMFQRSTIQILPSYSEGMPTSLIEGLSFGLPIVSSNVGVIPEVIKEGVNGFLMNPGDRTKFSEIILKLSRDPRLVKQMSRTNRKYFLEEFTIEIFCKRIADYTLTLHKTSG